LRKSKHEEAANAHLLAKAKAHREAMKKRSATKAEKRIIHYLRKDSRKRANASIKKISTKDRKLR